MVSKFDQKVYSLTKRIPPGRITTYQEIARALDTKAYRAVGKSLSRNPFAPKVPCHRVVSNNGTLGGFGGQKTGREVLRKKKMLKDEGIEFDGDRIINFEKIFFRFHSPTNFTETKT